MTSRETKSTGRRFGTGASSVAFVLTCWTIPGGTQTLTGGDATLDTKLSVESVRYCRSGTDTYVDLALLVTTTNSGTQPVAIVEPAVRVIWPRIVALPRNGQFFTWELRGGYFTFPAEPDPPPDVSKIALLDPGGRHRWQTVQSLPIIRAGVSVPDGPAELAILVDYFFGRTEWTAAWERVVAPSGATVAANKVEAMVRFAVRVPQIIDPCEP
jgi:hypothetical protein